MDETLAPRARVPIVISRSAKLPLSNSMETKKKIFFSIS